MPDEQFKTSRPSRTASGITTMKIIFFRDMLHNSFKRKNYAIDINARNVNIFYIELECFGNVTQTQYF